MNRRRKFADELLWLNVLPIPDELLLESEKQSQAAVENLHIAVMLRGEVTSVGSLSLHLRLCNTNMTRQSLPLMIITE